MQSASSMTTDDLKALDQARNRMVAIVKSLEGIEGDLMRHEPLPNWPSLQKSSALLLRNITSLLNSTTTNNEALQRMHSSPLATFPGQSQSNLLHQLLRKKLEPNVEDWISEGLGYASKFCEMGEFGDGSAAGQTEDGLDEYSVSELWEWAGPAENDIARQVFTAEDEDEEDDEDDEDEEDEEDEPMKDAAPAKDTEPPRLPLGTVLTYMSTGAVPKVVDRAQEERDMQAALKMRQARTAQAEMDRRAGITR
ncbi:uncharacterized protein BDZ99DRAFT_458863 [Mytilinidion resinicola]|uniref:Mediator of RNA polymerase II transcription subunit 8 n=1 Tax=Mytilinidion resinicola TaxID=574789 RepID=A0A6A6Z3R4_9PEZI|nr:uncharacterized protein BDZ99DRAFT_458863 [Mytilinidion resinicola]KAF2814897.1 hypothetical protein BDZ99DRAFT_458863 [Mytilinidion resinicola]